MSVKIKVYGSGGAILYEKSVDGGATYEGVSEFDSVHFTFTELDDQILLMRTDLRDDSRIFQGLKTDVLDELGGAIPDVIAYLTDLASDGGGGGSSDWGDIEGDINSQTDLIDIVSEIMVSGNLSVSEFNGSIQFNSNATEYYGCDTILKGGVYSQFELPYKNRVATSGTAFLYGIILDQSNNTIAYKRLSVSSGGSATGSFIIAFDSPVQIPQSGIYQVVIGRRKFNGTSKKVELFHKDVNSSDGRVWVAYAGNNNQLDTDDTSSVNWSSVSKQNFNRIPKNLIYKS